MILFPAIDLKDGQCVRLVKGDMGRATVFNDDPASQAAAFEALGFEYLHLVDLNGAFAGTPVNGDAVEAVLAAIGIPAQLGGGIRDLATIETWLDKARRTRETRPATVTQAARWMVTNLVATVQAVKLTRNPRGIPGGKLTSERIIQSNPYRSSIERMAH